MEATQHLHAMTDDDALNACLALLREVDAAAGPGSDPVAVLMVVADALQDRDVEVEIVHRQLPTGNPNCPNKRVYMLKMDAGLAGARGATTWDEAMRLQRVERGVVSPPSVFGEQENVVLTNATLANIKALKPQVESLLSALDMDRNTAPAPLAAGKLLPPRL